jgi:hypothetical protein
MRVLMAALLIACGPSPRGGDDGPDAGAGAGSGSGSGSAMTACKHVDVVIAVDNSSSMHDEKQALRDIAFPGFAAALKNIAGGIEDFRVGVLDACNNPASFHTRGVGGGCNFSSGRVWMESSSPRLVDEFKCVGDVDSADMLCTGENDDEQPATSAATALEPAWMGAGKPNEGFLRDNALLVIVAITDEDEQPVPGANAQEIYDRFVALKGGDVNKIVFVGIGGAMTCDGLYGHAREASKLHNVTNKFVAKQRGLLWDLCQGNLEQGLATALSTISSACEDFGPIL